ncbi:MAG: preprotein translocase subunit SecA [Candidatus Walczuchella monophlebidarum]
MNFREKILKSFFVNKNERDIHNAKQFLTKIKKFESTISSLSHDELRNKTILFKKILKKKTKKIYNNIISLHKQADKEKDVDVKENLYEIIDSKKKILYNLEEKILLEILPEAFAVIKETARRFKENVEIHVKITPFDQILDDKKKYVVLQKNIAIWKHIWYANGKPIVWDMVHYDTQLIGGVILHKGKIAEMATGEGKTLVATLPIYLNSLTGRGIHIVTISDYLAKRDAAWMAPIMEFHGLSVDCINNYFPNTYMRRKAYAADITYGTSNEFGFDYLRDNIACSIEEIVQRELNYAIIDEIDSVLIDDARTPLVISGAISQETYNEFNILKPKVENIIQQQRIQLNKTFNEAKKLIELGDPKNGVFKLLQVYRGFPKYKPLIKFLNEENIRLLLPEYMQDKDLHKIDDNLYFIIDEKNNTIELTDKGINFLSNFFIVRDLITDIVQLEYKKLPKKKENKQKEELLKEFFLKSKRLHMFNQLLKAYTFFEKNIDYIVLYGSVKIIDEQTGRIMEGRRYSDVLHQALEAKENVKIESSTQTFATITLQNYFRMYKKLAGMTGTAATESGEFGQIYKLDVVTIPPHKPVQRKDYQNLVFKTKREKYNAIINEILKISKKEKRPILVGTTSIEVSELLSRTLKLKKIHHNVLNAKLHKEEANIIAKAGNKGVITIATNMAGRGTDIKLSPEAKSAGGLAILGTECHDSRRIDKQLRGRSGRQGDPGSSQFFISLEDNLMRLFGSYRIAKVMDKLGHKEGDIIQHPLITRSIEQAQKKIEEKNFSLRKRLLEYDDVINKQREVIYRKRKNALLGERLSIDIATMLYYTIQNLVSSNKELNNFEHLQYEWVHNFASESLIKSEDFTSIKKKEIVNSLYHDALNSLQLRQEHIAAIFFPLIEKIYKAQYKLIQVPITDGVRNIYAVLDIKKAYESKGKSFIRECERATVLSLIDEKWKEHLKEIDELRDSVQNAVYEQKDPLLIYKVEAFNLFQKTMNEINRETISFLFQANFSLPEFYDSLTLNK